MKISQIDNAIAYCNKHLIDSNAKGTEIEAFLTRYLIVFICANYEEKIEEIIIKKAEKSKDNSLISYVKSSLSQIFRSIKTSEIAGLLNKFGTEYKNSFQSKINGTQEETFYNNIVVNRHLTAHSRGINITFDELVKHYDKSHIVLDYVKDVLK